MSQRKNPDLDAQHQAILRKMMQLPENKTCADCNGPSPRWASTNLGVFLCISCSGIHRKLGTHISKVRSITLDTWTPDQVAHFQKYGNAKAARYFEACLPEGFRRPNASDARQMELFIRDKYENKRYITVENGGMGGQGGAVGGNSLRNAPVPGPRSRGGLGARPFQSTYDSESNTLSSGKNTFSGFGNSVPRQSTVRATPTRLQTNFGGMRQNNSGSNSTSHLQGAMRRASTLREIMNMGFSADIAARAVEASDGDLKLALDWVLEQDDQARTSRSANQPPPQVKKPVPDLLSEVTVAPAVTAPSSNPKQATPQSTKTEDAFADFADFGDFESALPAPSATTTETKSQTNVTSNNILSGDALRKLYEQGPKPHIPQPDAVRSPVMKMQSPIRRALPQTAMPTIAPFGNPTLRQPRLNSSISPTGLRAKPATNLAPSLGGSSNLPSTMKQILTPTSRNSQLQQQKSPTKSTIVTTSNNLDVKNGATRSEVMQKMATSAPPPPPEETAIVQESTVPPPTAPPPTITESKSGKDLKDDSPPKGPEEETIENGKGSNQNEKVEEEDPFAALSMMALSSAKSNISNKPAKGVPAAATTMKQTHGIGSINLDELLG